MRDVMPFFDSTEDGNSIGFPQIVLALVVSTQKHNTKSKPATETTIVKYRTTHYKHPPDKYEKKTATKRKTIVDEIGAQRRCIQAKR